VVIELELDNWIYNSVPTDIRPETTREERETLLNLLQEQKTNISAERISKILGYKWVDNSLKVRKLITEILLFDGTPIIATSKGYKLAKDKAELIEYYESLVNRLKGIYRRVKSIERIIAVSEAMRYD